MAASVFSTGLSFPERLGTCFLCLLSLCVNSLLCGARGNAVLSHVMYGVLIKASSISKEQAWDCLTTVLLLVAAMSFYAVG